MSMDQRALESLSGAQQIIVMKSLKQEAAAWLLGVTARTLRDHSHTVERNADDSYDARVVVSSGLLKAEPPELSADEQEKCIRTAELLNEEVSPAVMRLFRELEDKHGDRGLAELVRVMKETWADDYGKTESEPPQLSEAELREQIEEEFRQGFETQLRSRIDSNADARLKRGVVCEDCGKVRRGRTWVTGTAKADEHYLKGYCPKCHDLQQQPSRRKKRRAISPLVSALMDD